MTIKDLKKFIDLFPEDTLVARNDGEYGPGAASSLKMLTLAVYREGKEIDIQDAYMLPDKSWESSGEREDESGKVIAPSFETVLLIS